MIYINNIGLQLWSIREEMSEKLLDTLHSAARMGYAGVQFAGFGNNSAEDVKNKMDEVGIRAMGAHVQLPDLQTNFQKTVDYHKIIGNDLIIVPSIDESMRGTAAAYNQTALILNNLGKKLAAQGMMLGYHNHDFEFDVFDGKTGLDIIFENTNEDYLKMELDCFWASYTNNDPLEILNKYGSRCVSLHIKDLKIEDGVPISTELGTGRLPLMSYMQKGKECGVKSYIVEQEHFTKGPLKIAEENAEYINKIADKLSQE